MKFDERIKESKFNFFEIAGFKEKPLLAVKAGMAIGYQMACDDIKQKLEDAKEAGDE